MQKNEWMNEQKNEVAFQLSNPEKAKQGPALKVSAIENSPLLEEVRAAVHGKQPTVEESLYDRLEWEEPVRLDQYTVPAFPVDIFPRDIRHMVEAVAGFTQTPPDMAAMVAIGALSTSLSKTFFIEPKEGWIEPLNTYTLPLMESSNRKSPVFLSMTGPIYAVEKQRIAKEETAIKKQHAERSALEKRIEKLQADFAKNNEDNTKDEIHEVVEQLNRLPERHPTSLVLDDATAEVLVVRLKENQEKLAILSAEGDLLEKLKSDPVKLDIFLKAYSGDRLRVDRIGRKTEHLDQPLLTICLSAQPTIIQHLPDVLHGRGFIARFLFSVPEDFIGYRDPDAPVIPQHVKAAYGDLLEKLLDFSPEQPVTLSLDEAGQWFLKRFQQDLEMEFREGGILHESLKAWGGKLVGQLLRITGLLHVVSHANTGRDMADIPTVISSDILATAFRLEGYFIRHAEKAFGLMRQNGAQTDAQLVLHKLLKEGCPIVSRQAIWQKTRKTIGTAERLDAAFRVLESRYYIQRILSGKTGRKEFICLNPSLFQKGNPRFTIPNV